MRGLTSLKPLNLEKDQVTDASVDYLGTINKASNTGLAHAQVSGVRRTALLHSAPTALGDEAKILETYEAWVVPQKDPFLLQPVTPGDAPQIPTITRTY